jgi:DNA-binding MarR family transcriptional regulator
VDDHGTSSRLALIDLADAVLALARQLELRGHAARDLAALTNTEITVIREVHRAPGATATQIAAITGLQRSYVSASASGLEGRGLLTRGATGDGGRGVGLHPTAQADADLRRVQQHWVDLLSPSADAILAAGTAATEALERIAHDIAVARAAADAAPAPSASE